MSFPRNKLLTRKQLAAALTDAGYPTTAAGLATGATRGNSAPYQRYGRHALYQWGRALDWAQARCGPLVQSTSERDRLRPERPLGLPEDLPPK
jgi:hypothetical protein